MRSRFLTAAALSFSLALGGCESFDPLDKLSDLDIMGVSKKPLTGERRPVFDSGVPGVPQGVPPEMVKGYQPPPEAPPPVVEAKPVKPKPKKTASAPRRAPPPPQQQMRPAPAAQTTTTQPVTQSAGQMQTMPGAQPTWPNSAPPAPAAWPGPQR